MVWTPRPFAPRQFARRSDAASGTSILRAGCQSSSACRRHGHTVTGSVTEGSCPIAACGPFRVGSASRVVGSILAAHECMVQSEITSFTEQLLQHCAVRSTPDASAWPDAMKRLPVAVSICAGQSSLPRSVSARLKVTCPASADQVLVQRCSFCRFGEGLLLDPADDSLLMICSFQAK